MDQNLNLMTDDEALEYLAELSQFESDTDGEDIFDDDFDETVHVGDVFSQGFHDSDDSTYAHTSSNATKLASTTELTTLIDAVPSTSLDTAGFSKQFGMHNLCFEIHIFTTYFSAYEELSVSVDSLIDVRSNCGTFIGESANIDPQSNEFKKISWEQSKLQLYSSQLTFRGNTSLPDEIAFLRTPCEFFSYFVTDQFLIEITNQTNLYAKKRNAKTTFTVDMIELKKYIGILVFMSVYKYPNERSYWGRYGFDLIRSAMTVNRFEEISRYIHFADGSKVPKKGSSDYDALHKFRPVIDHFNKRFSSVPMLPRLCVDEQMCATKMKATNIRQYMPNKPHKWGFKLFVLCDSTGFSYAFEIYTGTLYSLMFVYSVSEK